MVAALAFVGATSVGQANVLRCLPGLHAHVYERRVLIVSAKEAARLHADLERHASEVGLSYSAVAGDDPSVEPAYHGMTSILQSASVSTVIEVSTSNRTHDARLTVGNNCFAPKEDWRPYWRKLNALIARLGYGSPR